MGFIEIPVTTFVSFDWSVDRFIDCGGVSEWVIDLYLWSCPLYVLLLSNHIFGTRPNVLSFFNISISTPSGLVFVKVLKTLKTFPCSSKFILFILYMTFYPPRTFIDL